MNHCGKIYFFSKKSCRALLLPALLSACHSAKVADPSGKEPFCISDSMQKIITIDSAVMRSVDDQLNLSGEINFDDNKVVKLFPFSSGQVVRVNVSLGDRVQKGQVLAIIKSADVAGNYSDLAGSGNDLAIAKKQMENEESLFKSGIASEREYTDARENYLKALENSNKIKDQIAINGGGHTSPNGTYIITSPINGYVVEKKISQGGFIRSDNSDNLFTIGDISDVWVWANVYETDISRVKEGYTAHVSTLAYPDSVFTGVVDKVNQILDPETKVMKIRVRLPNRQQKLKPEMFANITIENKEGRKAVSVPIESVINDNGRNYVIVYHDRCKLECREVNIIKTAKGFAYIGSGLSNAEQVISRNQILLFNALKEQ